MKGKARLELSPQERLQQLSQVCLACQETIRQWFDARGWALVDLKCADSAAIATDRKFHDEAAHDAMIADLWRRALATPERSESHVFFRFPRLLIRSQH